MRELREHRGVAQEVASFDAGVGKNYVTMLELGRLTPTFAVLLGLARTLGPTERSAAARRAASARWAADRGRSV